MTKDLEMAPAGTPSPLAETEWYPVVDTTRLDDRAIIDLLRDLALAAFQRAYGDGQAVVLKSGEAARLRPILGGQTWLKRRPLRALAYLRPILHFTSKPIDFRNNDVALVLGATLERSGPLGRWLNHRRARRSALLGSDGLFAAYRWVAWSDPRLNLKAIAMIRQVWREKTLFHPAEPRWPTHLHPDLILLVLRLAMNESTKGGQGYTTERAGRALRQALDADLEAVRATLGEASQIEQLIAVDVHRRLAGPPHGALDAVILQLPVANISDMMKIDAGRSGEAQKEPLDDSVRVAIEDFVVQLSRERP